MDLNGEGFKEGAKAVQEVAKATGKGVDAGRELGGFIARFVSGSLEQGMGIVEDKLAYMRWERRQRLMVRAVTVQRELGLGDPDRAVPLKVAIPLFQGASLEDDDSLQDRWVNLLINAAYSESSVEVERAYVEILSQLNPLEAQILDAIYTLPFDNTQYGGIFTSDLPHSAVAATGAGDDLPEPSEAVQVALSNLHRIGCLRLGMSWGGGEYFRRITPTVLGRNFVRACRLRAEPPSNK